MIDNKKILYVHNANFNFINANKIQVMNMCNGFTENNCDINLLAFGNKNNSKKYNFNSDVNLYLFDFNFNYYLRSIYLFLKFYRLGNFDLIYTRDIIFTYLVLLFTKKNIIYELHEFKESFLWRFIFKLVFNRLKNLVVISGGLKKKLISLGFDDKNITVLHDGVDLNNFNLNLSKKKSRESLKLPLNKKIILYIGSFQDWKGYKYFLEASLLDASSEIIFYCVGGTDNQITSLKKNYLNVNFKSFIDSKKVPLWLKSADILVIPNSGKTDISKYYTSPLKLFEYMASKTPIVASDLPSIRDVVSDEEVLFFDPDNSKDLYDKLMNLLNSKSLNKNLTKNSFEKVKNYTWENRVKYILELI